MSSRLYRSLGLSLLLCIGRLAAMAQDPLTLRQAIDEALRQSPQAAIARADLSDTKAAAAMARTQLLTQFNFTEDISRGNDPDYVRSFYLRDSYECRESRTVWRLRTFSDIESECR